MQEIFKTEYDNEQLIDALLVTRDLKQLHRTHNPEGSNFKHYHEREWAIKQELMRRLNTCELK